jgi:metal-responsive CopG/Arc/MetJ family transcriptional regulator
MGKGIILAVRVQNRVAEASDMQKVLTEYGCNIKARLGLHEVHDDSCASDGLVLLVCVGKDGELKELEKKLSKVDGIKVSKTDLPVF